MKRLSYCIFFIFSFVMFSLDVFAGKIVIITDNEVRFRTAPSTNSGIITQFNYGTELGLISENAGSGNGCNSAWYKVSYNNQEGYICSEFAKIEEVQEVSMDDYTEYSEYLKALGFPDTYIPYLVKLHASHPDWDFRIYNITEDFNSMVTKEYDGYYKGWSLIEDTGRYYDGYKATDSWSYNYLTDTFSNSFTGGGRYWFAANKAVIGYYMDPRNFLNDRQVFMFETLSYNSAYHTRAGVEKMLANTFMTGYANSEHTKTYVDAFIDAANQYNISPYVLISRVIQEVGAMGSTIVSGNVSGYQGYYNFYNINAAGNSAAETIANGLNYAKSMGWNSPYKAIVGGASFLANDYVSVGQNTLYLQKWDMVGPTYVNHQYMQNIQAPSTESIKTYNAYNGVGLVNSSFVFSIPVYKNMPEKTNLPSSGNPNNYLSSLAVNGNYLFKTVTTENSFNIVLDKSTTSIDISASKVNNQATINGTGSVSLKEDAQSIIVRVTAGNGAVRDYTINVTRKTTDSTTSIDISEILRLLEVKNDGTYIYGYKLGTDVANIIKSITDKESHATVTYLNKDNAEKKSGNVATGDTIKIKTEREEKTYKIVIYGDINGDGGITSADYIAVKNHIMDIKKLSDVYMTAADANKDNNLNSADYIAIKNHIMGTKTIS